MFQDVRSSRTYTQSRTALRPSMSKSPDALLPFRCKSLQSCRTKVHNPHRESRGHVLLFPDTIHANIRGSSNPESANFRFASEGEYFCKCCRTSSLQKVLHL